tara:strand:- start:1505 stop:1774 length:270 start_codon:yes stop_codon:yes gene_type:complete
MDTDFTKYWFDWFYKNWEVFTPGDLLEKGLTSSQLADNFVSANQKELNEIAKEIDQLTYTNLEDYMKLSESELLILKYFLKLVKTNLTI